MKEKMFRAGAILILVSGILALAQKPASLKSEPTVVTGVVVDSATGAPIPRALVEISSGSQASGITDANGAFRISIQVQPYVMVSAQKPGFRRENLETPPDLGNIRVKLHRLNVISGRIIDSDGEPASQVQVEVYGRSFRKGKVNWYRASWDTTDDRGRFRIANLSAGKYAVRVSGRESRGTTPVVGNALGFGVTEREAFPPVWHGGQDIRSATPIVLGSGDQVNVDITVRVQNAYRISGTVRNMGPAGVSLRVLDEAGIALGARTAFVRDTGQFQIIDVPPGMWTLEAWTDSPLRPESRATRSRAVEQVMVGSRNVSNVLLELAPPVNVPVAMHTEDKDRNFLPVALTPVQNGPVEDEFSRPPALMISAEGSQALIGPLYPGDYVLSMGRYGPYMSSAMSGSTDILHGGVLTVTKGSTPQPVDIVFRNDGGRIQGHVEGVAADQHYAVLIVDGRGQPADLECIADYQGHFESGPLAPGEYRVFAMPVESEYANPGSWEPYDGVAKRVQVEAKGVQSVTLSAPQEPAR